MAELNARLNDSGPDAPGVDKPGISTPQEAPPAVFVPEPSNGAGWAAFWSLALAGSMCMFLMGLVTPDISIAFFSGGVDPCAGENHGTLACHEGLKKTSLIGAIAGAIGALMTLFGAPFIGSITDAVGSHRMIQLAMMLGVAVMTCLCGTVFLGLSYYYTIVINELLFLLPAKMLCQVWIAEHTVPGERLKVFARLGAVFSLETVGASVAAQFSNLHQTVLVATACQVLAMVCGFFLPATRKERQVKAKHDSLVDWGGLARLMQNRTCQVVLLIVTVGTTTDAGSNAIFFFYCKERFGTTFKDLALILIAQTFTTVIIQVFFADLIGKWLGVKGIIRCCSSVVIVALLILIFAPSLVWIFPAMMLLGSTGIINSAMTSLLVNIATAPGENSMGASVGILSSVITVPIFIGPLLYRAVFFFFLQGPNPFPGAVWVLSIILMIFNITIASVVDPALFKLADHYQEESAKGAESVETRDQAAGAPMCSAS